MKQKQHSTEEIIRILRQAETDVTIDSVCREHNVSKATSIAGNANTVRWTWPMPNGLKSLKKKMLSSRRCWLNPC